MNPKRKNHILEPWAFLGALLLPFACAAAEASDQVWQIDFQGGPGGAYGSADPILCSTDLGDGATWNAFEIPATNDQSNIRPWPVKSHNPVTDPELLDLKDSTGAPTGIDLKFTGRVSAYNVGGTLKRGGIDHAYGDHWFFGQQGNSTLTLEFEFRGLEPGLYELTTVVNPNPHIPPRDLYFKIGGVRHDIVPKSVAGYAEPGTFDATIKGLRVDESGRIQGLLGTLESQINDGQEKSEADPSLGAMILRRIAKAQPTLAVDDGITMKRNGSGTIKILENDFPDQAVTKVTLASKPAGGTAVLQEDNTILYTNTSGTPGEDTFAYQFTDQSGQSNPATVTVTISDQD